MSAPVNTGGPAFPTAEQRFSNGTLNVEATYGMTLRDYFAAMAMQGVCASGPGNHVTNEHIASEAYAIADAMLKAREADHA